MYRSLSLAIAIVVNSMVIANETPTPHLRLAPYREKLGRSHPFCRAMCRMPFGPTSRRWLSIGDNSLDFPSW